MAEVHFKSNACECCSGDKLDCGCTFPHYNKINKLEKQIKNLKKKLKEKK